MSSRSVKPATAPAPTCRRRSVLRAVRGAAVVVSLVAGAAGAVRAGAEALELFPETVPVGAKPHSIVAADLDGDGLPDLATANGPNATVSVFKGTGGGSFAAPAAYSVDVDGGGSELISITAGDFDGDEDTDLAVADLRNNAVHVLENDGSGGFGDSFTSFETGSRPFHVIAPDLDADGAVDLVSANSGGNSVTLLFGAGDGTFARRGDDLRAGSSPRGVAAGDLDGDSDLDLAVANESSSDVSVFQNQAGVFSLLRTAPVLGRPTFVAAVNVDGDADLDLALTDSQETSVTILVNQGSASFVFGAPLSTGTTSFSLTAADIDGDGLGDLVTANELADTVSVLRGVAGGSFAPAQGVLVGTTPRMVAAVDIDGDGDTDLVSANRTSEDLTILFNGPRPPAGPLFRRGDVDADGELIITDPTLIFDHLFLSGAPLTCQKSADFDDNGALELSDGIFILSFLFLAGPPPAAPFEECGEDPTEDGLGCEAFAACPAGG